MLRAAKAIIFPRIGSGRSLGLIFALAALVCLCIVPVAEAASPAWKVLAATGPTNLPPRQSETDKLFVKATGGTFTLTAGFRASLLIDTVEAAISTKAGDTSAMVTAVQGGGGSFEVGDRIASSALGATEVFVESCSPSCTAGSTIQLSAPAEQDSSEESAQIFTRKASVESGEVPAGFALASSDESLAPGTTVTSAQGSRVTLSRPPAAAYYPGEVTSVSAVETTAPINIADSSEGIRTNLEALNVIGEGAVTVTADSLTNDEHTYLVAFSGPLVDRNLSMLPNPGGLSGTAATAEVATVVPGGPGTGELTVNAANIGSVPTAGEYSVTVGPLPSGVVVRKAASGEEWSCAGQAGSQLVTCSSESVVRPLTPAQNISVPLEVVTPAAPSAAVPVNISGGSASAATTSADITISDQQAPQGVSAFWAGSFDENGGPVSQAGAHPFSAATFFMLNTIRLPDGHIVTVGDPRTVTVDLPPGFSGNPLVTPRCPQVQPPQQEPQSPLCNKSSAIGILRPVAFSLGNLPVTRPTLLNSVPPQGYAAEFTGTVAGGLFQGLVGSVRSSEDYGIRITAVNIPTFARIYGAFAALEGFPNGAEGKPFLSNGTSCAEDARHSPSVRIQTETWQAAGSWSPTRAAGLPSVVNCAALEFDPNFSFRPSVTNGSSGTGAAAALHVPQEGLTDPNKLATPALKKAVVRLPEGLNLNAASANGLQACSEEQIGYRGSDFPLPTPIRFNEESPTCPDASKLGTVEVASPLVESPLTGTIYLAAQEENPFNSLLAIYVVIDDARSGVIAKLPGELRADPVTGQLTATFDHNPQLAFEDLKLVFRGGGPRSELATPEVCGHYATTGELEPWSAPESGPPTQIAEGGFDVSSGCSSSPSARPFAPTIEAGTTGTQAGAYSPLVIKVNRKDGEQELRSLDFTLPKGLLGRIAGIPYCSEASIRSAESKSGKAEQSSASCPSASQIGVVDTSAGVGAEPIHVGGKVYLAGPYKGAPLSSVVITPAVAGPFDLGDVVIRAPLYVDPETAQITAKSDQIPTILRGIPLKVRTVAIYLNRPGFTLNPTSCEPMAVTTSIQGFSGGKAAPSSRFQVGGCTALKFKPKLKLILKGSTHRTGHPGLKAVLTYPKKGVYANIARAQVNLPHSEFLDQGNLNKTCTKPVLLEGKCPKSTIYGRARAWTPLLENPVEGPVYLVGGYGYKLPALVADLNGQIRVVLKGKVDTGKNKGIRNTFEAVPDAPVSRFVLNLKRGKKYSLLENSENLCAKPQRAIARFTAQNGLVRQFKTRIVNRCGKKKAAKHGKKAKKHSKKAKNGGRKH